jgi:hypothetical protein
LSTSIPLPEELIVQYSKVSARVVQIVREAIEPAADLRQSPSDPMLGLGLCLLLIANVLCTVGIGAPVPILLKYWLLIYTAELVAVGVWYIHRATRRMP